MAGHFRYFCSSIGKKFLMGVTGLVVVGFVISHLLGNLQVFLGPEAINAYAAFLKDLGGTLWIFRGGLLLAFIAHILLGISLTRENRAARPRAYVSKNTVQATLASRTMFATGMVILIFVLVHLAHFTFGVLDPQNYAVHDGQGRHDVYRMMILGFQNPFYSVFYILCMVFLGYHLSHALASSVQTLGILRSPGAYRTWGAFSRGFGVVVAVGYAIIPVAVMLGVLTV